MTLDEATRANYVHVEALPRAPAGAVLVSRVRADGDLTQWIVSTAPARARDRRGTRQPLSLTDRLGQLADESRRSSARLCTWRSLDFDGPGATSLLRVPSSLARRCTIAIGIVTAWAESCYGFAEGRNSAGIGPLASFLKVAGYRPDGHARHRLSMRLITGSTQSQNGGEARRSRRLEASVRRCIGLRHVVIRAAAEMEKRHAYLNSTYTVQHDARELRFRIGSRSRAVDSLVVNHGAQHWAHVSARDPGLETLGREENRRRSDALTAMARQRGYLVLEGAGQDRRQERPAEDTRCIVGMPEAEARVLARLFGQWAIVAGRVAGPATLVWCLDSGPDPLVLNQLATRIAIGAP